MNAPDHAETLELFKHVRAVRTPSKLAPGAEQLQITLVCPRCDHARPLTETYRKFNCGGCGLGMMAGVAHLYVWTDEMEPADA